MITIKDIAIKARVSTGTVDRVLHNRGGVSKKTYSKVKALLEENNFKVNVIASTLAMRKKYHICAIIPSHDDHNLFWKSPLNGILKAAKELQSYGVQISNFTYNQHDSLDYLTQFKKLQEAKPDAVIMVPTFIEETKVVVSNLEEKEIPYIFLNIDVDGFNNICFVGQDSFKSGYLAGKLMHLCLTGGSCLTVQTRLMEHKYYVTNQRLKGFKAFYESNDIPMEWHTVSIYDIHDQEKTQQILNDFLESHPKVKGVFVPSSRIAGIVNGIPRKQLESLRLIGFDTTPQNIVCLKNQKITFLISQKSFNQGYNSVQIMADFLIHKTVPNTKRLSPIDIITLENLAYSEHQDNRMVSY